MSLSKSKWVDKTKSEPKEANPWHETTISEGLLADLLTPFIAPNQQITRVIFGDVTDGMIPLTYAIQKEGR